MSVGVVGCCRCCPGGVLTAEGGPRHSWRRFPCASLAGGLALAPSVSFLPTVSYRVVSPWWLLWTPRVAVGEVALSVVPSVMPVVRSLRALLWFPASLMLLMLVVVGVGLCVGCQWLLLLLLVVLVAGRWVARLERLGCNMAVGWFLVLVRCSRGCLRRRAGCRGCWCCRRRPRWFRVSPLVRVLWRSVWVLAAVQVWVSQFLALGLGVAGWVLLGVGARHSWLRARWRSFASRAGVLGDAAGGGALGVTWCPGRGGGGRGGGVVGEGTLARRWWGWWWCG